MPAPRRHLRSVIALTTAFLTQLPGAADAGWKETLLVSFNGANGSGPVGNLIADSAGNLYGVTALGGEFGDGTVFKLSPPAAGTTNWTETVLFSFFGVGGRYPDGGLIVDSKGNLYGTSSLGGGSDEGSVFELSPPVKGQTNWTETVLYSFPSPRLASPEGSLLAVEHGNLYGAAGGGDASTDGMIYKLSPPAKGQTNWTEGLICAFNGKNGSTPNGGLIEDTAGNLYGTTSVGGAHQSGTVFELLPPGIAKHKWTERVLASFSLKIGFMPNGSLIADSAGNLYGTTADGGEPHGGGGTVFQLSPPAAGNTRWTLATLVSFKGPNGANPMGGLLVDKYGDLYGTTYSDGPKVGGGVFELSPPKAGTTNWTEALLYAFGLANGSGPVGRLIADSAGNLYGATLNGGPTRNGTVFELSPP